MNRQKNQRIQKMKAIDLSERQKQILAYMDAGVEYSTEQVAEKIGLKGPRTRQLLNELVNMELLACIGTTKREVILKCRSGCYVGDNKHEQIFRKRLENIQK